MQVIFNIEGREAIPVRVLPWLTDWHFGAVQIAYALAHENDYETFKLVSAFAATSTGLKKLLPRRWISVIQALEELEDQNLPRLDWEKGATLLLPDGVYVWRDEWEAAYNESRDGPGMLERMQENDEYREEIEVRRLVTEPTSIPHYFESAINRPSAVDGPNIDIGEMLRLLTIQAGVMNFQASALEHNAKTPAVVRAEVNLAQQVYLKSNACVEQARPDIFSSSETNQQSHTTGSKSEITELSVSNSSTPHIDVYTTQRSTAPNKPWSDALLNEVVAFHREHGLKKTAERLGISESAVTRHLAKLKTKQIKAKTSSSWCPT